ncbi:MAG: major facilitator superfamily transporter [Frankiales bacterium]|nr:major facilitator superfamily transporter [Frankiales bacterium]
MRASDLEKRGLLLAFAVFGLFWGAWASLLPAVKDNAGLSDGQLGLAMGAIAFAALPSMPLAGRLVDRLGAAKLVRLSLLAFGLVTPLPALADGLGVLIPAFVLIGCTTGFLDVVVNTATAAWERIEAGRLMAYCHGLFSAGMLAGSVVTGFARNAGAGPGHVLPVVGLVVVGAALAQPSYRRPPREEHEPGRSRLGLVLLLIGVLVAASFLVEDGMQSWSALHLERDLDARPWVSGLGPGLFAAAMTAGRLGSHVLGAGHRDEVVVASGGGAVAAGALLLAVAPAPALALVGVVIAGAGCSILAPTLFSAVGARSRPGREGAALGAVSTLGYAGFLIGPPVIGLLSAATSLPVALGLMGVVGLLVAAAGPVVLRLPARV